jgi:hypothetical protein
MTADSVSVPGTGQIEAVMPDRKRRPTLLVTLVILCAATILLSTQVWLPVLPKDDSVFFCAAWASGGYDFQAFWRPAGEHYGMPPQVSLHSMCGYASSFAASPSRGSVTRPHRPQAENR